MLKGKTVVLGVTGSIAAYKIANLASMLVKQHADVNVIMTHNAANFINPITFETLTGNKCIVDTFDRNFQFNVEHVSLAKKADCVMIAPAMTQLVKDVSGYIKVIVVNNSGSEYDYAADGLNVITAQTMTSWQARIMAMLCLTDKNITDWQEFFN